MRRLDLFRWLLGGALLAATVLTVFLALPLRDLRIRVNDLELCPRQSDVLAVDEAVREAFGSDDRLIIAVEGPRGAVTDTDFRGDVRFFLARSPPATTSTCCCSTGLPAPASARAGARRALLLHAPTPPGSGGAALHGGDAASSPPAVPATQSSWRPRRSPLRGRAIVDQVREAAARLEDRRPGAYPCG